MNRLATLLLAGLLVGPALASADAGSGATLFANHCVACHQPDAQGAVGIAPPLAGTLAGYVGSESGRTYLVSVPLTGMVGKIVVNGQGYNSNMPSFASLGDGEIAEVLAHVLREFNGGADSGWLTAAFVAGVRQQGGTPNATHKLRAKVQP